MTSANGHLSSALLQSCWIIEAARADVFARWGYDAHAERSVLRVERLGTFLESISIDVPDAYRGDHADWLASIAGEVPDEVPLGTAIVQRLAEWSNHYLGPFGMPGHDDFVALGDNPLTLPVPPRTMSDAEMLLDGRATGDRGVARVVVLTDIHIGAAHADRLAQAAVADINALQPDLVLVPGDVTEDAEPWQFETARTILDALRAPWRAVPGNHDTLTRRTRTPADRYFASAMGGPARDQVEVAGGVQFALIDTTDPTPWPWSTFSLASVGFRDDAAGTDSGALRPGQADALAARLDPSMPVVVVGHHELQPFCAFPPLQFGLRPADSQELCDALSGHRLLGVIAGHTHRSALSGVGRARTLPQLEVPAIRDWPFAFTVLDVNEGAVRARVRQISDADLVRELSQTITPIQQRYSTGRSASLVHELA